MELRKLELKDAPKMLEWMTAKDVNNYFRFDPKMISLESCEQFIKNSFNDLNKTYAIDINEEYIGSISLKNIDMQNLNAEFAISIRNNYRGQGFGKNAIKKILKIAFEDLKLHKVYLNVFSDNSRAIKLYEESGFKYEGELKEHIIINGAYKNLKLYGILKEEYYEPNRKN